MSLQRTQDFLARIYTDEDLRRSFLSAPETVGRENGLTEPEAMELAGILPDELNFFAETLFYKRLREVEKLLPLTRGLLGKDFEKRFRPFAAKFSPISVRKHLEDAIEFAINLHSNGEIEPDWSRDLAGYEGARLQFYNGKNLLFRVFDHDIRPILKAPSLTNEQVDLQKTVLRKRKTYALWLRFHRTTRQFIW